MNIQNHLLFDFNGKPVPFDQTPNTGGPLVNPQLVIIHYTAGPSLENSARWFKNPNSRASSHLLIGRDGEILQMAPFNVVTWHAGRSEWNNLSSLNNHSIGIELDNAGKLSRKGGKWTSWFEKHYSERDVMVATHRHDEEPAGWHRFTQEQIETTLEVVSALVREYNLTDVLGHDEVSPYRKKDPGPAFPMTSIRSKVLGRFVDESGIFETIADLNIRSGPGTEFHKLEGSPLPKGTPVEVLSHHDHWRFVQPLGDVSGVMDLEGWVHGKYLKMISRPGEDHTHTVNPVRVRTAPVESLPTTTNITLNSGQEVKVVGAHGDWRKVEIHNDDSSTAWVHREDLGSSRAL